MLTGLAWLLLAAVSLPQTSHVCWHWESLAALSLPLVTVAVTMALAIHSHLPYGQLVLHDTQCAQVGRQTGSLFSVFTGLLEACNSHGNWTF